MENLFNQILYLILSSVHLKRSSQKISLLLFWWSSEEDQLETFGIETFLDVDLFHRGASRTTTFTANI